MVRKGLHRAVLLHIQIGEIGLNHNGDLQLAEKMIRAAAECGVDAVKFQTFKTDLFLSKSFPGFEEREGLEFKYEWHLPLQQIANELGVIPAATNSTARPDHSSPGVNSQSNGDVH